jgi:hypothetical protein
MVITVTVRSHESQFVYSAAGLRHVGEMHPGPLCRHDWKSTGARLLIYAPLFGTQRHRYRLQAFASFARGYRAQSAHSSIAVSCFGARGVGSRIAPQLQPSRFKPGVLPTGEIDKHWLRQLRHVSYSPCFSRSSITRVVIGTVRCHDFGRMFSGFGANERRAQCAQAPTSRHVAEHSAMRV